MNRHRPAVSSADRSTGKVSARDIRAVRPRDCPTQAVSTTSRRATGLPAERTSINDANAGAVGQRRARFVPDRSEVAVPDAWQQMIGVVLRGC